MSTIIIPGGSGLGLGSIITTAINVAILYFLFTYVRSHWDKVTSMIKLPKMDFTKLNLGFGVGDREGYYTMPSTKKTRPTQDSSELIKFPVGTVVVPTSVGVFLPAQGPDQ